MTRSQIEFALGLENGERSTARPNAGIESSSAARRCGRGHESGTCEHRRPQSPPGAAAASRPHSGVSSRSRAPDCGCRARRSRLRGRGGYAATVRGGDRDLGAPVDRRLRLGAAQAAAADGRRGETLSRHRKCGRAGVRQDDGVVGIDGAADGIGRAWAQFLAEMPLVLSPTWTQLPFEAGFDVASPEGTAATIEMMRPVLPANLVGLAFGLCSSRTRLGDRPADRCTAHGSASPR